MGLSSVVVVLPRDWARGNEIGPGDEVEITYDGSNVNIRRAGSPPKESGEVKEGAAASVPVEGA